MTWLVDRLNRRIMFLEPMQKPSDNGGLAQTYRQLGKGPVWAEVKPVGTSAGSYVRNVQIEDAPTHSITVRRSVPMGVDIYGTGFVKADNFIYLLSSNSPSVGRLFRILSASNIDEADESISFLVKEIGQLDTQKGIVR
jgi:hypothetical protein